MAVFVRYEDIDAWKMGRELVKSVYAMTRSGEFAKDRGLRDQMQRAAVSICSNIAEGYERRGNKEFVKFLWIAKGSAAELSSQLYHAKDLDYITSEMFDAQYAAAKNIAGKIYNLIQSISTSGRGSDFIRH